MQKPPAYDTFETSMQSPPLSAIDIGSNAIRMIIGEVRDQRLEILRKLRAPVRLGKDVFRQGKISAETMREAEQAFVRFRQLNEEMSISHCRAVATSAVREATNRDEFEKRIFKKSGIRIETIDGIEEARLVHFAVQREVDFSKKRIMLIDIGGGSVEITFSEKGLMSASQSFPMGTVRMLQMLEQRKLTEKDLKVIMGEFVTPLSGFLDSHTGQSPTEWAVGTGGNFECMGKLKVQLLGKSPATLVSLNELVEISHRLQKMSIKERIEKLKLRPDRADVILPAIMLVKTILRQAGLGKILIPGVGLRDGLLWSLAESLHS